MAKDEDIAQLSGQTVATRHSIVSLVAALVGLTATAVVLGVLLGRHLAEAVRVAKRDDEQALGSQAIGKYGADLELRELPPIIANLADPPDARIRLQAAIIFVGNGVGKSDVLAAQIGEDILGFIRTLSLGQVGGASGLQHLREDLNERATIRSDGRVRELVIQALVVQ
ncbi:flagellar basal body-associated FliL family protein [Methylocapsa acidiphila]|uniref:flagellar basal body-associated FliL family protein n=1 Tax=Methylocapsa acidiphila TaxID=133552 RepID=UPI000685A8C1|nr:flagellar basal body-associated FliL family protein [Methylocapsa acidiphila]